uniref:NADH-ubiquinone oxidoreductase chain 3 n=1 Tax=Phaenacantha marcida TaxID=498930 RepID=B7SMJ8_9HEMI|nr:NADH dehydrogenase subunit 3 [Phaenacantha marcida]ABZ02092.1 NADH dehydrogenase subunit 3 [Phaenacantha marcida]
MMKVMIMMMTSMIMSATIMAMCTVMSKKSYMDREKMTPFECGFDPKSSARTPFSIQFFLITILFLIFDIEIIIIMPMVLTMKISNKIMWAWTVTVFMIILIVGLFYEWKTNMLEWS